MPDIAPHDIKTEVEYLSVADVAYLTSRRQDVIRRYIRDGVIDSIPDPTDRRTRLVPDTELIKVIRRPQHGLVRRRVTLTLSDGSTVTRVIPVRKEG